MNNTVLYGINDSDQGFFIMLEPGISVQNIASRVANIRMKNPDIKMLYLVDKTGWIEV